MHTCKICSKEFDTEAALRGHMMGAHKGEKKAKAEVEQKPITPNLTSDQAAIAERASKQDNEWMTISEEEMEDFSLMNNPLDLPPEAAKEQNEKRLAFRWCERTPDRIDELTRSAQPPLRWAICTRTTTPFLTEYIDDVWGCVTRLDQVLLCKPWAHHALVQAAKQDMAKVQDQSGNLKGRKDQLSKDGIEAFEGKQHMITSSDQVMADEGLADLVA